MWIASKHGFYSIVKKHDGIHLRSRTKRDLLNLKLALEKQDAILPDIERWDGADYRWRIIITHRALQWVLMMLCETLDYSNFKSQISATPEQRHKLNGYHALWHAGCEWQRGEDLDALLLDYAASLAWSSVDDLKSSLHHVTDADVVRAAINLVSPVRDKTKHKLLTAKLRKLTA